MSDPTDLQLLEGDDDLLDYFLGEDQVNLGGLEMSDGNLGSESMYMDEVNDGMASLLTKEEAGKAMDASGVMTDADDGMFGDNFGLLEPIAASPPQAQWNQAQPPNTQTNIPAINANSRTSKTKANAKAKSSSSGSSTSVKPSSRVKQEKLKGTGGEAKVLDETEEKRLRRLARNRESARQSRRRKKEHLELLEERVAKLTSELDELRREHIEKVDRLMRQNHLADLQNLANLCAHGSVSDEEIKERIEGLLKVYGANSVDEKRLMDYHYKHIFALLLPTYTRYFLWMLNEGEQFFEDGTGKNGGGNGKPSVWQSFCNEIHLSQDQQEKLKSDFKQQHGEAAREERLKLSHCIRYLEHLRKGFVLRSKVVETQSRALFEILNPQQIVKYLLWAEKNKIRIEETGANDLLFLSTEATTAVLDPKLQAARAVLEKPEEAMKIDDLKILMAALDGQ